LGPLSLKFHDERDNLRVIALVARKVAADWIGS
jgi:hypothetical protein